MILDSLQSTKSVSSHFSAFVRLIQHRPFSTSQPRAVRCKASAHIGVTSSDSPDVSFFLPGSMIFNGYIIFWTPIQFSWSHFFLGCPPYVIYMAFPSSFFYFKTQVHSFYGNQPSYAEFQRGLLVCILQMNLKAIPIMN